MKPRYKVMAAGAVIGTLDTLTAEAPKITGCDGLQEARAWVALAQEWGLRSHVDQKVDRDGGRSVVAPAWFVELASAAHWTTAARNHLAMPEDEIALARKILDARGAEAVEAMWRVGGAEAVEKLASVVVEEPKV